MIDPGRLTFSEMLLRRKLAGSTGVALGLVKTYASSGHASPTRSRMRFWLTRCS